MKASRTTAAALALLFVVSVLAISVQAAPGIQRKPEPMASVKAQMPKEIAAVIQEGLATRQGRQDIPFSFFRQIVLHTKDGNRYPIFFFKAKNGDLGYAPSASVAGEMQTNLNVFFQFLRQGTDGALQQALGGKYQTVLTTPAEGYSPDLEDWYSLGWGLTPGKYTLVLVLATPDMKKISVGYSDITLGGVEEYEKELWVTEPIIMKGAMDQVDADPRPYIHRGYFAWGPIKVVPNITGELAVGEPIDFFCFIHGATVKDPADQKQPLDLEVTLGVSGEDGKQVIPWNPAAFDSIYISLAIPLIKVVETRDEKGTVLNTEKKPLPPGKYFFTVAVKDKISGKTGAARVAFSVK